MSKYGCYNSCGLDTKTKWSGSYSGCDSILVTVDDQTTFSQRQVTLTITYVSPGVYLTNWNNQFNNQVLAYINENGTAILQGTGPEGETFTVTALKIKNRRVRKVRTNYTALFRDGESIRKIDAVGLLKRTC